MARINFEDNTYKRIEWEKLKSEVRNEIFRTFSKHGLSPSDYCLFSEDLEATSSHVAKGLLVSAWTLAQHYWLDNRSLIPVEKWNLVKFASCVVASGFAELRDGYIYIKGSEEQFKWLEQKRDAGRKGGLAKQANHKKRDDIEGKKESNFGRGDVPWPNEQDEKLSTIQDDAIHQDDGLSTFDQYDNNYQYQNSSNASRNSSNASRNSSNASRNSSNASQPLENFYPPTPTLSPPPPSSLNFSKKEKEEKLIEASTNFVYEEKTSAIDEHFDNACQKYREKFEHRVDWKINAGQNAKLRYSQLIKSGVNHDQVLDMINNYADAKFTRYPNRDGFFSIHQTFERFLGFPGDWHCKKYLTPIVIDDRSKLERNPQSKVRADLEEQARLERAAENKAKRLFRLGYNLEDKKIINDRIENEKRMKQEGKSESKPADLSGTDFKTPLDILNGMNFKF